MLLRIGMVQIQISLHRPRREQRPRPRPAAPHRLPVDPERYLQESRAKAMQYLYGGHTIR